jgi:CrcB protein
MLELEICGSLLLAPAGDSTRWGVIVHSVGVGVLGPHATLVAMSAAPSVGRNVRIGVLQWPQHTIGRMMWIAVAIGGALGSLARHGINHLVHVRWLTTRFPLGTVIVNLSGCFIIGLLAGLAASDRFVVRAPMREFVFVGLLGGFTTFSSFGLDTLMLTRGGSLGPAVLNIALQVAGGLIVVWLGYQFGARST